MGEKEITQHLMNFGLAGIVILWFMLRAEGRLDRITREIADLSGKIVGLTGQVTEVRADVKEVTGVHPTQGALLPKKEIEK